MAHVSMPFHATKGPMLWKPIRDETFLLSAVNQGVETLETESSGIQGKSANFGSVHRLNDKQRLCVGPCAKVVVDICQ